jgi:uroporphyrinogen-III synthase
MSAQLQGLRVLVTRSASQASVLARKIGAAGGEAVLLPGIEIEEKSATEIHAGFAAAADADLLVFVSPNAARIALAALANAAMLPAHARVAAVGAGTARELKKQGVREIIVPRLGSDTEALLECPEIEALGPGTRAVIVRGEGGRELLARTLRSRGIDVSFIECYRRLRPARDAAALRPLWQDGAFAAWTATSAEIVDNLFNLAGEEGRTWLLGAPLFVTHPRIAGRAFALGVRTVFVSGPGDAGLLDGILTWFCKLRP